MGGVNVTFTVTGGGGTVSATSATTSSAGTASVGSWTLGLAAGQNMLTAAASGGANPSAQLAATARNPLWTFMVYMAADNNLAREGITNLDQMEAAAVNPEVQIVVQAEFSATELQQLGCSAACFNRPNFNTFRYIFNGQGAQVPGPNGPATDIGNRNMTDPADLRDFVTWTKQSAPAEHYAIVLWNHGGGYRGLLIDETSAPGVYMSLNGLTTALSGVGAIDILAFDMCQMGAYETLTKASGLASFAVFSEKNVPGPGYPYDAVIAALEANPNVTPRNAAIMFADKFDALYVGSRYSTTVSAFDLGGFAAFEGTLNTLAASMQSNLASLSSGITAAAQGSQPFETPGVHDLGNFLDSLRVQITDPTIRSNIDGVRTSFSLFRLQQHARTSSGDLDVGRANGLSILMPSGVGTDRIPTSGPMSLAAYNALVGSKPWGQFVNAWMASQPTQGTADLGTNRFESYLVWDSAAVSKKADIDLWVLEPNGIVYSPALGTVSPNGAFTADSYPTDYLEGYLMNRFVQTGTYTFYAYLWTDPNNYGPVYTLYYRNSPTAAFQSLYSAPFPRLTTATSIQNDPAPTFAKIDSNQYTDIRQVATLSIAPNPPGFVSSSRVAGATAFAGGRVNLVAGSSFGAAPKVITAAQIRTIRSLAMRPHVNRTQIKSAPRLKLNFAVPMVTK